MKIISTLLLSFAVAIPAAAQSFDAVVSSAYAEYGVSSDALPKTKLTKLRKTFSSDLADALSDDARCAKRKKAPCKINFEVLFNAQNPQSRDVTVVAAGDLSSVACQKAQGGKQQCLEFAGEMRGRKARIRDIKYPAPQDSLRKMLGLKA